MRNIIILFLLISFPIYNITAQTNKEIAKEKGEEATKLMDDGHIDRSLELLEEAQKLDPDSHVYPYEMAYANYIRKDYKKSAEILKKLQKHKDANDLVYQLLGNSYDELGDPKEAMKIYERGLKKFPGSGRLYLESGVLHMRQEKYNEALDYFEKGISVDPAFPSNYYWASKLFCSSEEEVWGMIYGELFMNLERNSKRTMEISQLLYDTYSEEIKILDDTAVSVSFSKLNVIGFDGNKKLSLPFGMAVYEPALLSSIAGVKDINIGSLSRIRSNFIGFYFEKGYDKLFPNVLFEYQKQIKDLGYFEAYSHWILMQGDRYEFTGWQAQNEEKWNAFVEWFSQNPLKLSPENCFNRTKY